MSMMSTTHQPGPIGQLAALRASLGRFPRPIIEVMARVAVAAVFFKSGLTKIASWETTVGLFAEEYQVPVLPPEIAAYLATAAELICPFLIVVGLFARLGAAALLAMTIVIQLFVYPASWAEHLTWASILLYVVTRGPGVISIDHFVARALFGGR